MTQVETGRGGEIPAEVVTLRKLFGGETEQRVREDRLVPSPGEDGSLGAVGIFPIGMDWDSPFFSVHAAVLGGPSGPGGARNLTTANLTVDRDGRLSQSTMGARSDAYVAAPAIVRATVYDLPYIDPSQILKITEGNREHLQSTLLGLLVGEGDNDALRNREGPARSKLLQIRMQNPRLDRIIEEF